MGFRFVRLKQLISLLICFGVTIILWPVRAQMSERLCMMDNARPKPTTAWTLHAVLTHTRNGRDGGDRSHPAGHAG